MRYAIFVFILFLFAGCGSGENKSMGQATLSAPLNILPQTGQSVCYETPLTNKTTPCAGTGQDGETRAGAAWPVPRFTTVSQNVVRDELTGLEWTRNRNAPGPAECLPNSSKTWEAALSYIKCINRNFYLGHADWVLPNAVQLSSLLNADLDASFSDQFELSDWGYWWTSTTSASAPAVAFISLAEDGYASGRSKVEPSKVWPVRNGKPGTIALHRTNQTTCYDTFGTTVDCSGTGQDGDVLAGREWPDPRFTDNDDETITDNLTGVIWTKNTDFPYSEVCSPGLTDFPASVDYVKCLNDNMYLGYDDWRLPNEFEVRSRQNYSIPSIETSSWLANYGFYNFSSPYLQTWSSTVEANSGFAVGIWVGGGHWEDSYPLGHVWPVRGGIYH